MLSCIFCQRKIKSKRIHICKECKKFLPENFDLRNSDKTYIEKFYIANKEKSSVFECTASYGYLFLDSFNNMFCISKKVSKGKPLHFGDIFSITELLEVAIYCSDVKCYGRKILCNIKIKLRTKDFTKEFVVFYNERCSCVKRVDNKIEYHEPSKFIMIRNMFNQMIDNVKYGMTIKLKEIQAMQQKINSKAPSETQWARGILFLENKEYTNDEIKKRRNALIKMFHPDKNSSIDKSYAEKINNAFDMLVK